MRSFKPWIRVIAFLLICILVNHLFFVGVTPVTYAQLDMHNLETNKYDDIFLGTSKGSNNISPAVVDSVTGRRSTSLCLGNVYPLDCLYLAKEACRLGNPERIIYELDPSYVTVEEFQGMNDPFLLNAMESSSVKAQYCWDKYKDDDFRMVLNPWIFYRNGLFHMYNKIKSKMSKEYKECSPSLVNNEKVVYEGEGFLGHLRPEEEQQKAESWLSWSVESIKAEREEDFLRMVQYCKEKGIELVVIILPVPKETMEAHPEPYAASNQYYKEMMSKLGIEFIDFNYVNENEFDNSLRNYSDYEGHMYKDTAEKFSEILGKYLK